MSYNEKYNFLLSDFHGTKKKIVIDELDYTGSSSSIDALKGDDPVELEFAGEDKELFEENVFGSKLNFAIMAQNYGDYDEFLLVDDRKYRVTVKEETTEETKFTGSFTISQIASTTEFYAYIEPTGDFELDNTWGQVYDPYQTRVEGLRLKLANVPTVEDLTDNDVAATYSLQYFVVANSEEALHKLLQNFLDNYSDYSGEKNTDNYLYKLIRNNKYSYDYAWSIERHVYQRDELENYDDYWEQIYGGAEGDSFVDGHEGDNFQLKVDEDGTQITLFDYTLQSGDDKQYIISQAIDAINSNSDYKAEQGILEEDDILVTYIGSSDASNYILEVDTYSLNNDWSIVADGLNVIISEAFKNIWQGFILPGMTDRPYGAAPYAITIECTDGVGDLKSFNYSYGDEFPSYIDVIARVLQETGLKLDIYSAADRYEDDMDITKDPLQQLYIKQESIAGKKGGDIIKELLAPAGYELRQYKGIWLIKPIAATGVITCTIYDYKGNEKDSDTIDLKRYISNKQNHIDSGYGVNTGQDASLKIQAARKALLYKENYGLKDQLFKDPTFSVFDVDGTLLFWNGTGTDYQQNSDDLLVFNSADQKIWQEVPIIKDDLEVSVTLQGKFSIEIIADGAYWFNGSNFQDYPVSIEVDNDEKDTEKFTISFSNTIYDLDGEVIQLSIISKEAGAVVEKAEMNPEQTGFVKGKSQYLYFADNEGYKKEVNELEFKYGDVPVLPWNTKRYINLLMLNDETPTDNWDGQTLARGTAEIIAKETLQNSKEIEGTFWFSSNIPSFHNIESTFDGNIYKFLGGAYSLRFNRITGKWTQIDKSDPGGLVVEDRLFEGRPQGTETYNSSRGSYSGGGGGTGGTFELPDNIVFDGDLESGLRGVIIEFYGYNTSDEKITINHGLNRKNIIIILSQDGIPVDSTNYAKTYEDKNNIELKLIKPYENDTKFTARLL